MKSTAPPLMTDELPLRVEPKELEGAEQLLISNEAEMLRLLQQLCARNEPICLYIGDGERFALSSILHIDRAGMHLALPPGEMVTEIASAPDLFCVAAINRIKLQFLVRSNGLGIWENAKTLHVFPPDAILRLQRRDTYRLNIPFKKPLSCFVPCAQNDEMELSLVDISIGGIGILGIAPGLRFSPRQCHPGVRIELPEFGTVVADIEICSSADITLRNGIRTTRTGARFIDLSSGSQTIIQKYINKEERALFGGSPLSNR